jgi:hypothetical protein
VENEPITQMKGKYRWMSNFYEKPFQWNGYQWPTSEHAYQAMKHEGTLMFEVVRAATTPGNAKRLGQAKKARTDWDQVKISVMESILIAKFSDEELSQKLLDTGERPIYEGNNWGDRFWGCDFETLEGENHLGRILMRIRQDIRVYKSSLM